MAVRIICLYSGSPVSFWRRGCCFWQQYFCWLTFLCHGGAQSESDQSPIRARAECCRSFCGAYRDLARVIAEFLWSLVGVLLESCQDPYGIMSESWRSPSRILLEFPRSLAGSRPSHRVVSLEPCRRSSGVLPGSLWRPAVIMAESLRGPIGILSESCRSLGVVMPELWRSHARWHSTIAAMRVAVASDWRGGDQSFLAKGASLPGGSHLVRSPRARFSSISSRVYPLVSGMTFQIQKTPTNPTSP